MVPANWHRAMEDIPSDNHMPLFAPTAIYARLTRRQFLCSDVECSWLATSLLGSSSNGDGREEINADLFLVNRKRAAFPSELRQIYFG